ncbi:MAG: hypothetical protein HOV79_23760 [Hamadaea sp.]|nr:hypothetical protein [Hamadaea sp.]
MGLEKKLMKQFEGKSAQELADAPVTALEGLTKEDAEYLEKAFGIKTVRDLAKQKHFRWAQAIVVLAD